MYQFHNHLRHKPLDMYESSVSPTPRIASLRPRNVIRMDSYTLKTRHWIKRKWNLRYQWWVSWKRTGQDFCLLGCGDVWFGYVYRRFGGTSYFHIQVQNICKHQSDYTTSQPMRQQSSYSALQKTQISYSTKLATFKLWNTLRIIFFQYQTFRKSAISLMKLVTMCVLYFVE
jgi:hypothetical protein